MTSPLEERLARIETEIGRLLPRIVDADWVRATLGEQPGPLRPETVGRFIAPAAELLRRGGKRWRPLLMVLFAEMCGRADRAFPLAPLVELPHNGSLIIDDIEDGSPERRGGPAIHLAFGLDLAINAGNLLYFLPFRLIERSLPEAQERAAVYRCFLEEMTRLHLGQGLDILWHRDEDAVPAVEEYLQMCRLKTGSLARMAARLGVIAGGGTREQEQAAGRAAENFGAAFQIIDDVDNLTFGVPGKRKGDDIIEGKKSLPVILFWQRLQGRDPGRTRRLKELFALAARRPPAAPAEAIIEEACRLIASSGSLESSRRIARQLLEEARERIRLAFPAGEPRELILQLADGLLPADRAEPGGGANAH